jgi:glycosyltransferase involved in cell wall biosynthesis/predicted SAM-dependent methyltransferase
MSITINFGQNAKVLEVGGGDTPLFRPNMDLRKLPTTDIVHDCTKLPWPIPDATYDGVFTKYFLEHPSWRMTPAVISEIARVLKPGGRMISITPNTLEQCKEIARRNRIGIEESAMLFGGQEEADWNTHRAAFSPEYMTQLCNQVGLSIVKITPLNEQVITDMVTEAVKTPNPFNLIKAAPWYRDAKDAFVVKPKDLKLNLGSFTVMWKGWLNVDVLPMDQYAQENGFWFQQHDLRQKFPWSDNSVKVIDGSHVFEHFERPDDIPFLLECYRVLEPEGIIRLAVPDTRKIAEQYLAGKISEWTFNEGVKNAEDDAHAFYNLLTAGHPTFHDAASVTAKMKAAGFYQIQTMNPGDSRSSHIKEETKDMFPELSAYIEAMKPSTPILAPLKVCLISTPFLVTPPPRYGGLEQIVHDVAVELAQMGCDVTVIASKGSKVPGCKVIETLEPSNVVQVDWLEYEKKAYEIYKDQLAGFDVIHDNTWFAFAYLSKMANPALKVMHTHHGGLAWRSKPVDKMNIVGISDWMVKVYKAIGFDSKRVYNGVDLTKYKFQQKKGNRLLFVGRLDTFKQSDVAISAARKAGVGLDVVGGSFVQDKGYLESIKKECNVIIPSGETNDKYPYKETDIVLWLDATQEQKIMLYQNAKAVLFPSRMGEPFGLIVPEANACGSFVIGLRDGAIPETIAEGAGLIVGEEITSPETTPEMVIARKLRDVDALVAAIKKLDAITISPQICAKNAQRFSRRIMAEGYLALYREILKGNEW